MSATKESTKSKSRTDTSGAVLSKEDARGIGGDLSQEVAEMRHVLESIVGVPAPVPIAPLFEPEPFVRQQRTVFGRKAG